MGSCCTKTSSTDEREVRKKPNNEGTRGGRARGRKHANNENKSDHNGQFHEQRRERNGKVDLNSANVHELSVLHGVGKSKADAIVKYRSTNGPFNSIEDILYVPGLGQGTLNMIIDKVYIGKHHYRSPHSHKRKEEAIVPKTGSRTLRIATWNLKCFGTDRASDKNVLEVVCLTILNNQLDLIAFQELADPDVLDLICKELNSPKLKSVKRQHSNIQWSHTVSERTGRMYQSSEYNGFVWSNTHSLQLRNAGVLGGKSSGGDRFVRRPFIGHYKVGNWNFTVVSVHLKATGLDGSDTPQLKHEIQMLPTLMKALNEQGHSSILLMGDFNMDSNDKSFNELRNHHFHNLIPSTIPTNISGHNPRGNHQYDNLWATGGVWSRHKKNESGVIRDGLFVKDNETVSDHCPVWADLKV